MKKRIFYLLTVCILAASVALCCLTGCKTVDANKIKLVEVTHSVFYAPLYIALEGNFFENEGLTVELSNGGGSDKAMTALISGQADIGLMGPEASIYVANAEREDYPIIFGQLTKKDGSFLVGRNAVENFSWSMLANSEILGGRRGGMPAMTLEYALRNNNLIDKENITINYDIQFDMMVPSFQGGTGDYCTMFEPAASNFVKAGGGHILASVGEAAGDMPFTAFMTTKSYLDRNNERIARFAGAIQKAIDYLFSAQDIEIARLIAPSFVGTDVEMLSTAISAYKRIGAFCSNLVMKEQDFYRLQDVIINNGIMKTPVDFAKIVDNTIAQSLIAT